MFQSEICDLNGIFNRKKLTLISDTSKSEISDKNTSLNQFIPVGAHVSEIIDLKTFKTSIQYYLAKNLNIPTFKTM